MTLSEFELYLAQVDLVIRKSRKNFKSKNHSQSYDNLIKLYGEVKNRYKSFDYIQLRDCAYKILERIYIGVESLHYNKHTDIPKHLIDCLELTLNYWLDKPENFAVVFSHNSSTLRDFKTWPHYEKDINDLGLILNLGIKYEHRLIQITQPNVFNNEFISSIPCYHELGHFIESFYGIAHHIIASGIPFSYEKPAKTLSTLNKDDWSEIYHYMMEHFCDLFATQYLGVTMSEFLIFNADGDGFFPTHPATSKRQEVIKTFIDGTGTTENLKIVKRLKDAVKAQTKRRGYQRELEIKLIPLSNDPFKNDRPVKLKNNNECHSLFSLGWENFMNSTPFNNAYPNYNIRNSRINNLIKISIDKTINSMSLYTKLRYPWSN